MADDDFYAQWYSAKLWQMLPAIYRTLDSPGPPTVNGPLQELVNRIGAQAAVLRRSIDRLWENQSIETCDDWVIPYIGDLLATRIVSCLDARAQRLDVAKTIYYRRRSGTLGLIEELASDIAGHDARAVEFFRRLGRTRHNFDPPIGLVPGLSSFATSAALLAGPPPAGVIEGLSGPYTRTPAGGYADLRNVYGAGNTGTAFDEYAYTADLRAGRQSIGWQNIPHLGVFIWWLYAYPVTGSTPVQNSGNPNQFTFDPTGREIPLFAPSQRSAEDFGDNWVSPNEWQLQAAIRPALWKLIPEAFYPPPFGSGQAFSIAVGAGANPPIQNFALFRIDPEIGRFCFLAGPPVAGTPIPVSYSFGFSSTVGAGFDPSFLPTLTTPAASVPIVAGIKIDDALQALDADATLLFGDSTTFQGPLADPGANATPAVNLALVSQTGTRPVLRWTTRETWTLTGNDGDLVIQGLWLQGADLVIAGTWNAVTLQLCTIDPGTNDPKNPGTPLAAIDGVALAPSRIYIDGQVATFTVQNCITGPIIARNGAFETLIVNGSIVQALAQDPFALQSDAGSAALSRTTVLGPISLHALGASECILDDIATVENSQAGCVRFSTLAAGHNLHAPYRCATVPPVSGIFETRSFGAPNYARVSAGADLSVLADPTAKFVPSVLTGAANGAQPGAFCAEQQALTQRGLAQKLEEYSPISLTPVWVDADLNVDKNNGETP